MNQKALEIDKGMMEASSIDAIDNPIKLIADGDGVATELAIQTEQEVGVETEETKIT